MSNISANPRKSNGPSNTRTRKSGDGRKTGKNFPPRGEMGNVGKGSGRSSPASPSVKAAPKTTDLWWDAVAQQYRRDWQPPPPPGAVALVVQQVYPTDATGKPKKFDAAEFKAYYEILLGVYERQVARGVKHEDVSFGPSKFEAPPPAPRPATPVSRPSPEARPAAPDAGASTSSAPDLPPPPPLNPSAEDETSVPSNKSKGAPDRKTGTFSEITTHNSRLLGRLPNVTEDGESSGRSVKIESTAPGDLVLSLDSQFDLKRISPRGVLPFVKFPSSHPIVFGLPASFDVGNGGKMVFSTESIWKGSREDILCVVGTPDGSDSNRYPGMMENISKVLPDLSAAIKTGCKDRMARMAFCFEAEGNGRQILYVSHERGQQIDPRGLIQAGKVYHVGAQSILVGRAISSSLELVFMFLLVRDILVGGGGVVVHGGVSFPGYMHMYTRFLHVVNLLLLCHDETLRYVGGKKVQYYPTLMWEAKKTDDGKDVAELSQTVAITDVVYTMDVAPVPPPPSFPGGAPQADDVVPSNGPPAAESPSCGAGDSPPLRDAGLDEKPEVDSIDMDSVVSELPGVEGSRVAAEFQEARKHLSDEADRDAEKGLFFNPSPGRYAEERGSYACEKRQPTKEEFYPSGWGGGLEEDPDFREVCAGIDAQVFDGHVRYGDGDYSPAALVLPPGASDQPTEFRSNGPNLSLSAVFDRWADGDLRGVDLRGDQWSAFCRFVGTLRQ